MLSLCLSIAFTENIDATSMITTASTRTSTFTASSTIIFLLISASSASLCLSPASPFIYDLDNLHYIYGKLAVGDTSDEKVEQIYKNMDAILKTYFYVSDEQVQAIRTADSTQIQLIIEESVKNKYE